MSLVHDALKKADQERQAVMTMNGEATESFEGPEAPSALRKVLVVLVLLAVVFTAGSYFYKKRFVTSNVPQPKNFGASSGAPGGIPGQVYPSTPPPPSNAQLVADATQLTQSGRWEEAKVKWEKVVIAEPRNADAYNNLGLVLKKLNQNEAAFDQYRKALSIEPQCAECVNNMGALYLANRDLNEAESHFQKAIALKGDYADPYFHLGVLMEARGDINGAKKNYLKYMELARGISAENLLRVQQRISSLD